MPPHRDGRTPTDTDAGRSRLPPALVDAYRAAHYEVDDDTGPFVLRVDVRSAALAACHRAHGVRCSAFLTACNPGSRPAAAAVNSAAGAALAKRLRASGYQLLAGRGVDPAGSWPAEASLLALGLEPAEAAAIAREFGQAGLLWAGADAIPRLVLLE